MVLLVNGGNLLRSDLNFFRHRVSLKPHKACRDGLEGACHGLHLSITESGRCLHNVAQGLESQGIPNHILKLALREATGSKLLADELSVFQGIKLVCDLKSGNFFDALGNLVVSGLDAEFTRLVLKHEQIPDKLRERAVLILSGSTKFFQKLILPECHRELVVFHLPINRDGRQRLAVNRGIFDCRQFIELRRVIEKNECNDCQNGDDQHEDALVFSESLNHKNVMKMLI